MICALAEARQDEIVQSRAQILAAHARGLVGGFPAYEKAHRMRLTATFAAKFPRLPVEMVSKVVAFAFHTGYY